MGFRWRRLSGAGGKGEEWFLNLLLKYEETHGPHEETHVCSMCAGPRQQVCLTLCVRVTVVEEFPSFF